MNQDKHCKEGEHIWEVKGTDRPGNGSCRKCGVEETLSVIFDGMLKDLRTVMTELTNTMNETKKFLQLLTELKQAAYVKLARSMLDEMKK
jgi:hypothetical protein